MMDWETIKPKLQGEGAVILLEGTRDVPAELAPKLTAFAAWLANELPNAVFRSGNAEGSDTLFARGVESVDPARMIRNMPKTLSVK